MRQSLPFAFIKMVLNVKKIFTVLKVSADPLDMALGYRHIHPGFRVVTFKNNKQLH